MSTSTNQPTPNNQMQKVSRFFVHFWLAISIASFIYALYRIYLDGWDRGMNNLFIPGIAFVWYLFRRAMDKRMSNQQRPQ
jgi:hypothetical protein